MKPRYNLNIFFFTFTFHLILTLLFIFFYIYLILLKKPFSQVILLTFIKWYELIVKKKEYFF